MYVIFGKLWDYDYFNILLFDDRIILWKKFLERVMVSNIEVVWRYVDEILVVRGSININIVFIDVVDFLRGLSKREDGRGRVIVFFIDGYLMVGIVDFIYIWWNVKIRNEGLVFIFVLGFGYNVDMVFFEVLVYENGGFVWRIYEEFDVSD